MSRDVWAITSDQHCGSTLGLCSPEGVSLDDGGWYMPSEAQRALYSCWMDYWAQVALKVGKDDRLYVVVNGDLLDGDHHNTPQIISKNLPATQHRIALDVFELPLSLRPSAFFVIRGTEVHVGKSAGNEEALAEALGAEQTPGGNYSWWHLEVESNGVRMDFAHHGRMGQRPWTKMGGVSTLAAEIMLSCVEHESPIPDLVLRSHYHRWADSDENYRTRVIQLPGWQLSTGYVYRIAPRSIPSIGGLIVTCEDGEYEVEKVKFPWKREKAWRPKGEDR